MEERDHRKLFFLRSPCNISPSQPKARGQFPPPFFCAHKLAFGSMAISQQTQLPAPLRTVIVDDEPLARDLLRGMLASEPGIEVVGECRDGLEALAMLPQLRPDLLFLDIQMPELSGFDLLAQLPQDQLPAIIFVTAFDHFALQAFEVNAIDYLLKPFDDQRLGSAVARARQRLIANGHEQENAAKLQQLLAMLPGVNGHRQRVVARDGERLIFVPTETVEWFEADGKYIQIHSSMGSYTMREGMYRLETELDPARFVRISRSAIVNVDRIAELRPWFQGDFLVVLRNGKQLPTTRSWRGNIQRLVAGG